MFALRRNARWSNGDPVTANDFVYGLRRSIDPATLSRYRYHPEPDRERRRNRGGQAAARRSSAFAPSTTTRSKSGSTNPTPYFLGLLAHSATYPLHRASVEAHGEQFTRPGNLVSNGAFMLADWVVQSHIKVVRNPHYWDNENTRLEEVWFYPTEDLSAELQRYRAGELDQTYWIPTGQIDWIRENLPDELIIAPYLGSYFYGFNLTRPPFKDNLDAAAGAEPRDQSRRHRGPGSRRGPVPAYGWVPPVQDYTGQSMPEATWTQAEREAEAKRLYAAAGYSAENPLRTEIIYNTHDDHRRIAVAIAAMWKQLLGVETAIRSRNGRCTSRLAISRGTHRSIATAGSATTTMRSHSPSCCARLRDSTIPATTTPSTIAS